MQERVAALYKSYSVNKAFNYHNDEMNSYRITMIDIQIWQLH
jgi:hypothetical protein